MKENLKMKKEMRKEKNIIIMVFLFLKEIIYIIIEIKEKHLLKKDWNMMENFILIKNGMEKDMIKMVI